MTEINGIHHHGKDLPYPGKEDDLQRTCAVYLQHQYPNALWFHCPNGGSRNANEAAKLKGMGVRAGVSDLVILQPTWSLHTRNCKHGLLVELKAKGGKLQDTQTDFLLAAQERGYQVAVCWNLNAFKLLIDNYLR